MSAAASLGQYDRKRFAVSLPVADEYRIFNGDARYCVDAELGPILKIDIKGPGEYDDFAIVVEQSRWKGVIRPDVQFGCDYYFSPALGSNV